ncbi:hypothetical protein T492DRAFT_831475 [Pavlovales sp. CCMP2436]|nr:hypothetical protein T492DRAFT_831475 [Pavlovales sp. CCMP2436]
MQGLPAVAIRPDWGALLTVVAKYPRAVLRTLLDVSGGLTRPFSEIVEEVGIQDKFLKNYLNMLAFLLQGLPSDGTLTAVMAYLRKPSRVSSEVCRAPKTSQQSWVAQAPAYFLPLNTLLTIAMAT